MSDEMPAFRPERQRKILFRGKEIVTADLRDGKGYVSLRSLCDAFGLDARAQRKRLLRQQGYFQPYTVTILLETAGGPQPTMCLTASAVPMFLTGVDLDRVDNSEARELMLAFLDESHTVLAEHFGISERGEMQFLRQSVARMVAEQEVFEENLAKKVDAELAEIRRTHEEKVAQIRDAFANLRQQVSRIEQVAGPKVRLSPEQMGQLRQLIATLGTLMQENGVPKPYPGIYMDVTRLTGVSRSEDIRQEDFAEVVAFLERQVETLSRKRPAAGLSGTPE
jgi:hypothetical protein